MKRGAVVFAVIALLLLADGSYLQVANNQVGGDTGVLFGNPNFALSAGTVVLISGGVLLIGAAIMWLVAARRERQLRVGGGRVSQPGAAGIQAPVGAGRGQLPKEHGDQS
jgi:hypothetical protein